MRRSRWVSGLIATAVLGLSGCGGGSSSPGAKASDSSGSSPSGGASSTCTAAGAFKPVKADTLTVVTSLPGPGFWEGSDSDPSKIKAGYEYDLAKLFQQRLCMAKLVVRNEGFDAIVGGQVTDYDISLSQVSITDKRKKVVDFTTSYFESQQGVLVKKGNKVKVTTLAEARKIQWGVQTGTTAIDLLTLVKPGKRPQVFQQLPDAYTALDAGQVDAVLIDTAINLGEAARSKGTFEVVSQFAQPGGADQYGAIVPKGSTNLPTFDAILAAFKADGTLKKLADKDLTADPSSLTTITIS